MGREIKAVLVVLLCIISLFANMLIDRKLERKDESVDEDKNNFK